MNIARQHALTQAIRQLRQRYGKHVLFTGRQLELRPPLLRLSTTTASRNVNMSHH